MPIPFDRKRYFKADKRQLMQTGTLHIKLLRSQVVTLQEDPFCGEQYGKSVPFYPLEMRETYHIPKKLGSFLGSMMEIKIFTCDSLQ